MQPPCNGILDPLASHAHGPLPNSDCVISDGIGNPRSRHSGLRKGTLLLSQDGPHFFIPVRRVVFSFLDIPRYHQIDQSYAVVQGVKNKNEEERVYGAIERRVESSIQAASAMA